ncbi:MULTISPECIES: VOC family protein [unclassified Stenotrophomonas]|uniref:VOC family protein n=1 Tax=unclassified Stenotrophomonas TaxID=196198 RepID=UPI0024493147|nr:MULTISPECIES: VOC family protein [unclassified Stenotrophomonas]MBN5160207.1 VOC family protein [Stenotrophomonas maltophilia]MDG9842562.1 VOC family protein [Stenotrophomonas sp. GD04054]MDH0017910.1 VOC family protein [Stenotrophomonas sp. GD04028]MDH0578289.1 VOC family protein [Stenotrophomonas sp. GD03997]MDH0861908.1 VOC family protein [Stenotrophomonas sp. GD03882]
MDTPTASFIVNLDVPGLAAAEDFYIRAFGLRIGRRLGPGAVELLGGPTPLYLLQNEAGSAATDDGDVRDYERHWTPLHLDWVVDDIEAALVRAVAAGATLEQSVRERRWGRIAVLADPFGHGFCLIQFSGEGYNALVE